MASLERDQLSKSQEKEGNNTFYYIYDKIGGIII